MTKKVNAWPSLKRLLHVCDDPASFMGILLFSLLVDTLVDKGILSSQDLLDIHGFIDNPELTAAILEELASKEAP